MLSSEAAQFRAWMIKQGYSSESDTFRDCVMEALDRGLIQSSEDVYQLDHVWYRNSQTGEEGSFESLMLTAQPWEELQRIQR